MAKPYFYRIASFDIMKYNSGWNAKGVPGYQLSSNGSYFSDGPVGPYRLRDGKHGNGSVDDAFGRATLARLGGRMLVRLMPATPHQATAAIQSAFGGAPDQMMGGGFMLVTGGKPLTKHEIAMGQGARPHRNVYQVEASRGFIAFANDPGDALFLIVSPPGGPSPLEIGKQYHSRYPNIGLFDGGGPFWFRDTEGHCPPQNGRHEAPWFAIGMNGQFSP